MKYQSLKFQLRGVVPLVMHNGQLADPLNPYTKEMKKITGKRKKTDSDFEQLAKLEWYGSLYVHDGVPCIPGEVIEAAFIAGARKSKRGQQAKAGMLSDGFWPVEYDGPKNIDELWSDQSYRMTTAVRVQQNRVMRTRPIFREWKTTVQIDFFEDQFNLRDIADVLTTVGQSVGLCDWRPRFGRFEASVVN